MQSVSLPLVLFAAMGLQSCFASSHPRPAPMRFQRVIVQRTPPARDIAQALAGLGYMVRLADTNAGIVNTDWAEYTAPFGNNFVPMPVRDQVQVVLGAEGMTVAFNAQCNWRKSAAGGNPGSIMLETWGSALSGCDIRRDNEMHFMSTAGWEPCPTSSALPNTRIRTRYQAVIEALRVLGVPMRQPAAARAALPEACGRCPEQCEAERAGCNTGDVQACYRAGACVCRCKLEAGGCGEETAALEACTKQGEPRDAAATEPPADP